MFLTVKHLFYYRKSFERSKGDFPACPTHLVMFTSLNVKFPFRGERVKRETTPVYLGMTSELERTFTLKIYNKSYELN